jgi:hypothetical protein
VRQSDASIGLEHTSRGPRQLVCASPTLRSVWSTPVGRWLAGVFVVATAAALVGVPLRATYGARTTADEPQYLLTALSLWEDRSLDIGDELAAQRWRDFHEAPLPVQTEPLADGREVSPHDPLLAVLLAAPVGLFGWAGAKATLAVLAGALAALLAWTASRRFGVPIRTAAVVAGAFAVGMPLSSYGGQVYPELPAALAVTAAVAAVTGPLDRRGRIVLVAAVVALPWLAVKYVGVAAALAGVALWRLWRRGEPWAGVLGGLAAAGAAYVVAHRVLYGGWTVYAAGDHFVGGEHTVMGNAPDYAGRSRRLLGLLVDRGFGLAAWAPAWLLAVPALAVLVRRRPPGWVALVGPLAAGWSTATWVALTMHGWWSPGRQVVVVLPLAVLAVESWAASSPAVLRAVVALGAAGAVAWAWLAVEVARLDLRLVIDFEETSNPLARAWRLLLPELRSPTAGDWLRYGAWLVACALAIHLTKGPRPCPAPAPGTSLRSPPPSPPSPSASVPAATTTAATSAT